MDVSFFSFLMAAIWSSLLIALIYYGRRKRLLIRQFGISSVILLYLFCLVRMLFPVDFPFTRLIGIKGVFSSLYKSIHLNSITDAVQISLTQVLLFVWIVGAVIILVRWISQYRIALKKISTFDKTEDEQSVIILKTIVENSKRKLGVEVLRSAYTKIPMGVGVFKKRILLPNMEYTDLELYYILLHEYTHFLNRDLIVKMLAHIFCCIFWWNPIVYLLKKDLDQTLEIKCDLTITEGMSKQNKMDYLDTIIACLKNADGSMPFQSVKCNTFLVGSETNSEMVERFKMVAERHPVWNKTRYSSGYIVCLVCLMVFSYSFQVRSSFDVPKVDESKQIFFPEDIYVTKHSDGTYSMTTPDGTYNNVDEGTIEQMIKQGCEIK